MLQKIADYIRERSILTETLDDDFSDPAFAYDYNEVQECFFDGQDNDYVFIVGETGLRKKEMLSRICRDLHLRGVSKQDILYLDYELPVLHGEEIAPLLHTFYRDRAQSEEIYLIINEVQEAGDWFALLRSIKERFPKLKVLCSSSTPPYIFEKVYEEGAEYCRIIVLSQKNASNIKYQTQAFGVYRQFKYNRKGDIIEIKGLTKEGKRMARHVVPSMIDGVPVKVIASGAFHDRAEMVSIELPEGIEMIGDYAFSKCCNLAEINLPRSLQYIGEHTFFGAKSLRTIAGGEGVLHVGNSALYDTLWLKEQREWAIIGKTLYQYLGKARCAEVPRGVRAISSYAFAGTAIEEVWARDEILLGEGVFANCKQLKRVKIPLREITPFLFYGCERLEQDIRVAYVGKFGLYGCTSLKAVCAQGLGECALAGCDALVFAEIGGVIARGALYACERLTIFDFSRVKAIGAFAFAKTGVRELAFCGQGIGDFAFFGADKLTNVTIAPHSEVGYAILYRCDHICEMDISGKKKMRYYFAGEDSTIKALTVRNCICDDFARNHSTLEALTLVDIKTFGRWCFYNNSSLRKITMTNVTQIGDWAFAYCDGIESIECDRHTEFIGMNAFRYCHNLSRVVIYSNRVVSFGANAFYSTAADKCFFVPSNFVKAYCAMPIWKEYYIQPIVRDRSDK